MENPQLVGRGHADPKISQLLFFSEHVKQPVSTPPGVMLLLSNIPTGLGADQIHDTFELFGPILYCRLLLNAAPPGDRGRGHSPDCCVIVFKSSEAVVTALSYNELIILDRPVYLHSVGPDGVQLAKLVRNENSEDAVEEKKSEQKTDRGETAESTTIVTRPAADRSETEGDPGLPEESGAKEKEIVVENSSARGVRKDKVGVKESKCDEGAVSPHLDSAGTDKVGVKTNATPPSSKGKDRISARKSPNAPSPSRNRNSKGKRVEGAHAERATVAKKGTARQNAKDAQGATRPSHTKGQAAKPTTAGKANSHHGKEKPAKVSGKPQAAVRKGTFKLKGANMKIEQSKLAAIANTKANTKSTKARDKKSAKSGDRDRTDLRNSEKKGVVHSVKPSHAKAKPQARKAQQSRPAAMTNKKSPTKLSISSDAKTKTPQRAAKKKNDRKNSSVGQKRSLGSGGRRKNQDHAGKSLPESHQSLPKTFFPKEASGHYSSPINSFLPAGAGKRGGSKKPVSTGSFHQGPSSMKNSRKQNVHSFDKKHPGKFSFKNTFGKSQGRKKLQQAKPKKLMSSFTSKNKSPNEAKGRLVFGEECGLGSDAKTGRYVVGGQSEKSEFRRNSTIGSKSSDFDSQQLMYGRVEKRNGRKLLFF